MPDSAQAIYDNLLSSPGLQPSDYFNIGVGLYQAEVFDRAAEAFRRVADVAPTNRDAMFNLGQSLFEAEDWEGLRPVGESLVDFDGYNSNSYTMLAKALIETGEEQEAVRILEAREALPFTLENGQLQPRAGGGASVTAELANNSADEGSTITVRVTFLGYDGSSIGTVDVRVTAPPVDVAQEFRADFTSTETVMGYNFTVVNGG